MTLLPLAHCLQVSRAAMRAHNACGSSTWRSSWQCEVVMVEVGSGPFDVITCPVDGFDGGGGLPLGVFEPLLGSSESSFGHVKPPAGVAASPPADSFEATPGCVMVLSCPFRGLARVGEGVSLGLGPFGHVLVSRLGDVERGLPAGSFVGVVGESPLGGVHGQANVAEQNFEPVRDRGARTETCGRPWFVFPLLLGEGPALGHGGDVGAVDGDDGVEDVGRLGEIISLGDHADFVAVAPRRQRRTGRRESWRWRPGPWRWSRWRTDNRARWRRTPTGRAR